MTTILATISGILKPCTLQISKEITHGVTTYTHVSGDFEFIFQANTDYSISLLKSEVRYKGVAIEKTFYQPTEVIGPLKLHIQRHFLKQIERANKIDPTSLQRIIDNILGIPELSTVEGLDLKENHVWYSTRFRKFEIMAFPNVYRISPVEMRMPFHFRYRGTGIECPSLQFIEYQDQLFVAEDRRIDNKRSVFFQEHQLDNFIYEMNKLMISMENYSNLHIFSLNNKEQLYNSNDSSFFYCSTDDESILLKLHVGPNRELPEGWRKIHFDIFCKWNIKNKTVSLQVYQDKYEDPLEFELPKIESRFLKREINRNSYESYQRRGISTFALADPEDENSHFGHDLDYAYYSEYFNDLIRYVGLKYYPSIFSLQLIGCRVFSGQLSDEETSMLVSTFEKSQAKPVVQVYTP